MTLKVPSGRTINYPTSALNMYRYSFIILFVLFICVNSSKSYPNSENGVLQFYNENHDHGIFQQRRNSHPSPLSKRILRWTASKIEDGAQSVKSMWNNFKNNIKRPVLQRRTQYTGLSSRQTGLLWRSLISKAWNFVSGFFQKSERYFAKRRMDTDRQGVVSAFIPTAPVWAMPLAMVGVAVLLRDPINMLSNEIACKFQIYKMQLQR